jgi:hypothetical protein
MPPLTLRVSVGSSSFEAGMASPAPDVFLPPVLPLLVLHV